MVLEVSGSFSEWLSVMVSARPADGEKPLGVSPDVLSNFWQSGVPSCPVFFSGFARGVFQKRVDKSSLSLSRVAEGGPSKAWKKNNLPIHRHSAPFERIEGTKAPPCKQRYLLPTDVGSFRPGTSRATSPEKR